MQYWNVQWKRAVSKSWLSFRPSSLLHLCMCAVLHHALLCCVNESVWICGCPLNQKQASDSRLPAAAHTFLPLSPSPSCSSESMTFHTNTVEPKTVADPAPRKHHDHECESLLRFTEKVVSNLQTCKVYLWFCCVTCRWKQLSVNLCWMWLGNTYKSGKWVHLCCAEVFVSYGGCFYQTWCKIVSF